MSTSAESTQSTVSNAHRAIRFVWVTSQLPKYRIPVLGELAARSGIDLRVVYGTTPGLQNERPEGFVAQESPVRTLLVRGRPFLFWQTAQVSNAAKPKADVIGLFWNTRYLSLVPALIRAKMGRVPAVLWGHGYSKNESRLRFWLRMCIGRMATAVIVYEEKTAKRIIGAGMPASRVFVALNTLDQRPMQEARRVWLDDPVRMQDFRKAKDLEGRWVVLFVSRFEPENRVDLLIEAIAKLRKSYPEVLAVVVGSGVERSNLRELAAELDLSDHVRFVGGIYDELNLAGWMMCANVFCYPANIGLSLLHAFAYGLPVVTGDTVDSHNPEINAFEDGINGLMFPDGDADGLAETLERLRLDRALGKSLGEHGLQRVTDNYSLEIMVDGLEQAIRFAAQRRSR